MAREKFTFLLKVSTDCESITAFFGHALVLTLAHEHLHLNGKEMSTVCGHRFQIYRIFLCVYDLWEYTALTMPVRMTVPEIWMKLPQSDARTELMFFFTNL